MVRNGLGREADFSYWQCYEALDGPIAQLDRVTDFYSVGCRFESCWDRQYRGGFRSFALPPVPPEPRLPKTPAKRRHQGRSPCPSTIVIATGTARLAKSTAIPWWVRCARS